MEIQKKSRVNMVLEAIPYDEWVSASDISRKVGLNSRIIGQIISRNLINTHIHRKPEKATIGKTYVYKRKNRLIINSD